MTWLVYILRCADGTHYTGVTTDLPRRLGAHETGRGARYTRGRGPFVVVHVEAADGRGAALRREAEIKRLPPERKPGVARARAKARRARNRR